MDTKEKIYRDYHSKVCGYIQSRVNSVQDAEDIAADVFLKVYEKLESFDESKASFSTWIYTITRNTLRRYVYCPNLTQSNISRLTWIWTSLI